MWYVHRDRYLQHGFVPAREQSDLVCPICGWLIMDDEAIAWQGDDACHKDCLDEEEPEDGSQETC